MNDGVFKDRRYYHLIRHFQGYDAACRILCLELSGAITYNNIATILKQLQINIMIINRTSKKHSNGRPFLHHKDNISTDYIVESTYSISTWIPAAQDKLHAPGKHPVHLMQ